MAEPLSPEERTDLVDVWDADLPDDRLINESLAIARYEATVRQLESEIVALDDARRALIAERDALRTELRGTIDGLLQHPPAEATASYLRGYKRGASAR